MNTVTPHDAIVLRLIDIPHNRKTSYYIYRFMQEQCKNKNFLPSTVDAAVAKMCEHGERSAFDIVVARRESGKLTTSESDIFMSATLERISKELLDHRNMKAGDYKEEILGIAEKLDLSDDGVAALASWFAEHWLTDEALAIIEVRAMSSDTADTVFQALAHTGRQHDALMLGGLDRTIRALAKMPEGRGADFRILDLLRKHQASQDTVDFVIDHLIERNWTRLSSVHMYPYETLQHGASPSAINRLVMSYCKNGMYEYALRIVDEYRGTSLAEEELQTLLEHMPEVIEWAA